MIQSALSETIDRLANRAASAVVARTGLNVPALNAVLARRLAAAPGDPESLFADPVLEFSAGLGACHAHPWGIGGRSPASSSRGGPGWGGGRTDAAGSQTIRAST